MHDDAEHRPGRNHGKDGLGLAPMDFQQVVNYGKE